MRNKEAFNRNDRARLQERLPGLAKEIARRSGNLKAALDSFVVSTTPYIEWKDFYDNEEWNREDFASRYILLQERGSEYDYIARLLQS